MTIYTKTQLIDMAIDRLGDSPKWGNNTDVIHCILNTNSHYGEIKLWRQSSSTCELNTEGGWRYICTRHEFEQRIAERKVVTKPKEWEYCPECGSYEVSYEEGIHKQCADCSQEWFSDIDYTDVVRSHLQDNYLGEVKPTLEWWDYEKNEPLDFPPAGTECQYLEKGKWYKTTIVGMDSTDHCVYEVNDNDPDIREFPYNGWNCMFQFRPLAKLTERQQAGLKLYRSINYNSTESDRFVLNLERFDDYCKPYDEGMLK